MSTPLFSVIVPSYNRRTLISACITSIFSQSETDYEVIVVDDGSTDGTPELIAQYSSVRLVRQMNAGPGAARNRGIREARGTYAAFLDSDDLWFPWSLSTYRQVIGAHDGPSFVTGAPFTFHNNPELQDVGKSELQVMPYEDYFSSRDEWLWHGVSSFVIRREVLLSVGGFAEGQVNGEDAELAMRMGIAKGFVHIASPSMFAYRLHDGNVTLDHDKSKAGLEMLLEGERSGRFPGGTVRADERATIISRHIRPFAVECARRGEVARSLCLYKAILKDIARRRRWKFLFGLPVLATIGKIRRIVRRRTHEC